MVVTSAGGNPRRTSNGFDYNRAAMLLAVLEKRGGLKVSVCDAYINIIGGLWLDSSLAEGEYRRLTPEEIQKIQPDILSK